MVDIGNFLVELFTGSVKKDIVWTNFTDTYINLNKDSDGNDPDPYLGVTDNYIKKFQEFKDNKIASTPDFILFDNLLLGSFFEFIFKLPQLDLSSKKQFAGFDDALKHPFVNYSGRQITKSDS